MRIGLDYDGVITDSRELKSKRAQEEYGVRIPVSLFKWHQVVQGGLLTAQQYRDIQRAVHFGETENILAPFLPGLESYLPQLLVGNEVRIVTGRDGDAARFASSRLRGIGIGIPLTGVGHGVSKRDATRGLDVFIDDDLDKLVDLEVPHRFLFTHEYNLHERLPEGIKRVYSWEDLYQKIEKIAEVHR